MIKKLVSFARAYPAITATIAGTALLTVILVFAIPRIGSAINQSRINALETEKQEALKRERAARDQNLILQGQVKAKDEQIESLTSQIADSNKRVTNAHNETVTARTNYDKVRNSPARFNAADDAGRVNELGAELRGLYPDSP